MLGSSERSLPREEVAEQTKARTDFRSNRKRTPTSVRNPRGKGPKAEARLTARVAVLREAYPGGVVHGGWARSNQFGPSTGLPLY